MHPAVTLLMMGGVVGMGTLMAWYMYETMTYEAHQRRQYRERASHSAQAYKRTASSGEEADDRVMQQILLEVESKLRQLRRIQPGRERSRKIRQLRALYHPDRHGHLRGLQHLFEEVSRYINHATDAMLEEDLATGH